MHCKTTVIALETIFKIKQPTKAWGKFGKRVKGWETLNKWPRVKGFRETSSPTDLQTGFCFTQHLENKYHLMVLKLQVRCMACVRPASPSTGQEVGLQLTSHLTQKNCKNYRLIDNSSKGWGLGNKSNSIHVMDLDGNDFYPSKSWN